jgi:hypothetical protein
VKKSSKRSGRSGVVPRAGEPMYLDDRTSHGLFESDEGDRYIVGADDERGPFAIVLRHRFVPVFTWHVLTNKSLITGRWWGPFRVRLTSSVGWDHYVQKPGTIFVMEKSIGIDCHYGIEGGSAMPFGVLLQSTGEVRDAESWVIEAVETAFPFCERTKRGKLRYGATPSETAEPGDRAFVVELDPRSVMA